MNARANSIFFERHRNSIKLPRVNVHQHSQTQSVDLFGQATKIEKIKLLYPNNEGIGGNDGDFSITL